MSPRPALACFAVLAAFVSAACSKEDVARVSGASTRVSLTANAFAQPSASHCPEEMALVGDVCIDKWEAHLVRTDASGATVDVSPYERPPHGARAESRAGVVPQGYISRNEAADACKASEKRLCTAHEWLAACEGTTKKHVYPYGDQLRHGACNTGKPHLMQKLFGRDMRIYTFDAHYNSPKLNEFPGFLAKTGEYEECTTEEGVHDLVGNLHEWVSDDVGPAFRRFLLERHPDPHVFATATDGNGVFYGGFYSTESQNGTGCNYVTPAHDPAYHDYSTGFRCCRDAAP